MEALRIARQHLHVSQRDLARRAGLSFRGLQLLESPGHDARISSLEKVSAALGLPRSGISTLLDAFFRESPDSFHSASLRMLTASFDSWPVHLFDSVDAFRRRPDPALVRTPPAAGLAPRLRVLVASTVELLCAASEVPTPSWCRGVAPLSAPWFVSGVENLKAAALVESPAAFRKRNIFVLANFLDRV